jgi:hypothetical protein
LALDETIGAQFIEEGNADGGVPRNGDQETEAIDASRLLCRSGKGGERRYTKQDD